MRRKMAAERSQAGAGRQRRKRISNGGGGHHAMKMWDERNGNPNLFSINAFYYNTKRTFRRSMESLHRRALMVMLIWRQKKEASEEQWGERERERERERDNGRREIEKNRENRWSEKKTFSFFFYPSSSFSIWVLLHNTCIYVIVKGNMVKVINIKNIRFRVQIPLQ